MRELIALAVVGVVSTVAYASQPLVHRQLVTFDYSCKFEARGSSALSSDDQSSSYECRAEGSFCNEEFPEQNPECEAVEKPLRVSCSNGFHLDVLDAADEIENKTLWLNAEATDDDKLKDKFVTLRVKDFTSERGRQPFTKKADLVIVNRKAVRLSGSCEFEKIEPSPTPSPSPSVRP